MKSLSLTSLLLATATAIPLTPRSLSKPGYTTTFLDQFQGPAGSLPSPNNWLFDLGTSYPNGPPQWGNNEAETYTKDPSNIYLSHTNTLLITPQKSTTTGQWTSARIESQRSDFACATGHKLLVEARIKLGNAPPAQQQGIWPAFWALGASFRGNYTNWPMATEWDFLESVNGASTMYSTVHCGTAPGGPCNEYNGVGDGGVGFSRGVWHTVGFQVDRSMVGSGKVGTWRDETLTWFLDGSGVFEIAGARVGDQGVWTALAHAGHFLVLNVAVGGGWPGSPNAQTASGTGVGMEVDYVGVWRSN